ncbi:MAG: phage major capsid protein [Solirubrobacterales bacterium]
MTDQGIAVPEHIASRLDEAVRSMDEAREQYASAATENKELKETLDGLSAEIEMLKEAQKKASAASIPGLEAGPGKDQWSIDRYCALAWGKGVTPDNVKGPEFEVHQQVLEKMQLLNPEFIRQIESQVRTVTSATDSQGAYLMPETAFLEIIKNAAARTVMGRAGIRRLDGLVGPVSWNKGSGVTGYWIDTESSEAITASDPTFTRVNAKPHPYGALTNITYQMVNQPGGIAEQYINEEIALSLGRLKDLAMIQGSGASGQPLGIREKTGINTYDWSGSTPVWSGATQNISARGRAMIHAAREDDALSDQMSDWFWIMEPDAVLAISDVKDADGKNIFVGDQDPMLQRWMGAPVFSTTQIATATDADDVVTFVGDKNVLVDCNWGTLAFAHTNAHASNFAAGVDTLRAIGVTDIACLEPLSVVDGLNVDETPA